MKILRALAIALLFILMLSHVASAPDVGAAAEMALPRYLIDYTTSAATDGRLDRAAWAAAPWSSDYVWIDAGDAAPEKARFKTLYNRTGLYFLFEFESKILGPQPLDVVFPRACEIFLDPEGRGRWYLEYAVKC